MTREVKPSAVRADHPPRAEVRLAGLGELLLDRIDAVLDVGRDGAVHLERGRRQHVVQRVVVHRLRQPDGVRRLLRIELEQVRVRRVDGPGLQLDVVPDERDEAYAEREEA